MKHQAKTFFIGRLQVTRQQRLLLFVGCLTSNMLVYLRDGSAQTILRAATLRQKLQAKLSISVTVYWHLVNQSQHWLFNDRRLAG